MALRVEIAADVPVEVRSNDLRPRFKLPTALDHTRQYIGALIGINKEARWKTRFEWNVPIGSSSLTIVRIERFMPR